MDIFYSDGQQIRVGDVFIDLDNNQFTNTFYVLSKLVKDDEIIIEAKSIRNTGVHISSSKRLEPLKSGRGFKAKAKLLTRKEKTLEILDKLSNMEMDIPDLDQDLLTFWEGA